MGSLVIFGAGMRPSTKTPLGSYKGFFTNPFHVSYGPVNTRSRGGANRGEFKESIIHHFFFSLKKMGRRVLGMAKDKEKGAIC